MRVDVASVLARAWAMVRRDRAVLLPVAGVFFFLPVLTLRLLVPPPPLPAAALEPGSREANAAALALIDWSGRHGLWWVVMLAVLAGGLLVVYTLYLDDDRPDVGAALARAGRLWPRFALTILLATPPFLAGLLMFTLPALFVMARLMLAGPALVAERPLAAGSALGRAWRLSRGASLPLTALMAVTVGCGWLMVQPLLRLDDWLRLQAGGANPVAVATVDAAVAVVVAIAALFSALVAIVVYRGATR